MRDILPIPGSSSMFVHLNPETLARALLCHLEGVTVDDHHFELAIVS